MSDILHKILQRKMEEVDHNRSLFPVALLERSIYFESPCVSMTEYLKKEEKHGIIAEIKRKSPSKGIINAHIQIEELSIAYMQAGASGLSILTDHPFFGGTKEDLLTARKFNFCPVLRKDFIIDEYQLFEAKSWGADVVLLIAAALTPSQCRALAARTVDLGMQVLLEVHNEEEIEKYVCEEVSIIGVNNRDLTSFKTSVDVSKRLSTLLPKEIIRISESGIQDASTIHELREYGYQGFLIGEAFMNYSHPEEGLKKLVRELDQLKPIAHAQA